MAALSPTSTHDICQIDPIYEPEGFHYSLPRAVLERFWAGTAFGEEPYSEGEVSKVEQATRNTYRQILESGPEKRKIALLSAGAPGAGKTTLLKEKMAGDNFAYVCPDDVCLPELTGERSNDPADYTKWRAGSNAMTHTILPYLIKQEYAFAFGTTCSSDKTQYFLNFLKERGYYIKVIHVSAPDQVRVDAIHLRDQTFVQTTDEDIEQKGLMVPQRINDTFLAFADEIEFHSRTEADQPATHAATWLRETQTLSIHDTPAYEVVKEVHNAAIDALEMPELRWEETIEKSSTLEQ